MTCPRQTKESLSGPRSGNHEIPPYLRRTIPGLVQTACGLEKPTEKVPENWLGLGAWDIHRDPCQVCARAYKAHGGDPRKYSA